MIKHLTTRQVALALGVSDASLKRWCDKGLIPTIRTVGGHRRLPVSGVIQYLLKSGHPLLRPDLLGMPLANATCGGGAIERCRKLMIKALIDGDEEGFRRAGLNLFLAGMKARDIFDKALSAILAEFETAISQGLIKPYQQHRIVHMIQRWLSELRLSLQRPVEAAPLAMGCAIDGDPLLGVVTSMMDVSLREVGWRTESLGGNIALPAMADIVREVRPRLFWIAIGAIPAAAPFLKDYDRLSSLADELGVALVVTSRVLTRELRQQMRYSAFCDTLGHLVGFARTLRGGAFVAPAARVVTAIRRGESA